MRIFITTPSCNQLDFLKRCVASVEDQVTESEEQGAGSIGVHHHIQDAQSTDGTVEFLAEHLANNSKLSVVSYIFSYESAPDEGMYDAVRTGWRMAPDNMDVMAYLNCDEQYLPGALAEVARWFKECPEKDVLFGDVLIVDGEGQLVCGRKMVAPSKFHIMTDQLPLFTAAMFIRGSALEKHALYPDPEWKNIGDVELVLRMMMNGVRIGLLHDYVSAFSDTGQNMALDKVAAREYETIRKQAPRWARMLRWLWVLRHRVKKWMAGVYRLPPVAYSIYVNDLTSRTEFAVDNPDSRWFSRLGE
ncbi:MAG: glycosyltransferase [Pontiella sp.]